MFDAVQSHGGIVNLIAGDGLMAVFGAPQPLPSHARSAVAAAMDMADTMVLFNDERRSMHKPPIEIGVGIASGAMVAGYAGTNERATFTCVGDIVNVAARLESHTRAAKRTILVDGATHRAVGEDVAMEALGAIEVKGRAATVETFAVTR